MIKIKFLILLLFLFGCEEKNKTLDIKIKVTKHVINVEDINKELVENFWNVLQISYFDKNKNKIEDLSNNGTFFVKLSYKSGKFKKLSENCKLYLYPRDTNFKVVGSTNNKFDFFQIETAEFDTLNFNVFLESDNFLFKKNGKFIKRVFLGGIIQTIP